MGMPNGSSAQAIFERIDQLIGSSFNLPIIPVQTPAIKLIVSGLANHTLEADLQVSNQPGNKVQIFSDGIYVASSGETYMVKVDAEAPPRYLADAVVGGTDGCVSITTEDINGILTILPSINPQCLFNNLFNVADTNTIHLNLNTTDIPIILSANAKISAASGNTLVANSDGLYSSGGTGTVTGANNGLSLFGGNTVQLGGPLIQNTNIDFGSLYQLTFTNNPLVGIGTATPGATLDVQTTTRSSAISAANTFSFPQASGYFGAGVQLQVTGGSQAANSNFGAVLGQMWFNNSSGDITLTGSKIDGYAGVVGLAIKSGTSNIIAGSNSMIAGGHFSLAPAGSGNIAKAAGVHVGQIFAPPTSPYGPAYTGTISTFYGLFIEDVTSGVYAGNVTTKYGIYVDGASTNNVIGNITGPSDVRIKKNIATSKYGLDEIEKLRTVEFDFTDSTPANGKKNIGFIAQEIEDVIPEAITIGEAHGLEDFKFVNKDVIFAVLVNAIKELSAKVKALQAK